jgi:hypothetical protein
MVMILSDFQDLCQRGLADILYYTGMFEKNIEFGGAIPERRVDVQ